MATIPWHQRYGASNNIMTIIYIGHTSVSHNQLSINSLLIYLMLEIMP